MDDKTKNKVGDAVLDRHTAENSVGAPPSMEWFFRTKEHTFWTFQGLGWTGYGFVRLFSAVAAGFDLRYFSMVILAEVLIGLGMTLIMRQLYRRILEVKLPFLMAIIILFCGALGLLYSSIGLRLAAATMPGWLPFEGLAQFSNAVFGATVLFAWSTIYFGYHYYMSLQEQKEQVLKATAMAHQAQLKMLRYQLNPHFLFNTLNAISTLVLEKSEIDANRMLTKLSSFLRYTLVNQPTQRVTLDQELHALGLYLDIEKVRFQDRLTLEFDIVEKARTALIPSLILQPLVENAIKYAVAPVIDGGTIRLTANVAAGRLSIVLSDSGPGIKDLTNIVSQTGSGVGIANTNERLAQIYGDDHSISFRNMEPTGLGIFIEIPCEREKRI